MSDHGRLRDELLKDPDAVFQIEADLPSGNQLRGTVGPIINNRVMVRLTFTTQPPSEDDLAWGRRVMDSLMGGPPTFAATISTSTERAAAITEMQKFLGGGKG
jgi:hypothetical protein